VTVTGGFTDNGAGAGFPDGFAGNQGAMLINELKSQNYNPGVSGWAIFRNGNVEFNNGTFRGTVTGGSFVGNDFIIDPTGMFFYNGIPTAGNLVISIAPPGTIVDPLGNTVKPGGITIYGSGGSKVFMGLFGTSGEITFPSGAVNELEPSALVSSLVGFGAAQFIAEAIEGPQISLAGHTDWVGIQLNSPNSGGTSSSNGSIFYVDDAQVLHQLATWDNTGFNVRQGAYIPADGNSYTPGLMSLIVPGNILINTTGTVNLGPSFNVIAGVTYRIHMRVICVQGATASAQDIGFGGVTTGGPTQLTVSYIQEGAAQAFSTVMHQGTIGFFTSPAYTAARVFWLDIDGMFTPTVNGSVSMVASCSVAADTFTVVGGSFGDVWIA